MPIFFLCLSPPPTQKAVTDTNLCLQVQETSSPFLPKKNTPRPQDFQVKIFSRTFENSILYHSFTFVLKILYMSFIYFLLFQAFHLRTSLRARERLSSVSLKSFVLFIDLSSLQPEWCFSFQAKNAPTDDHVHSLTLVYKLFINPIYNVHLLLHWLKLESRLLRMFFNVLCRPKSVGSRKGRRVKESRRSKTNCQVYESKVCPLDSKVMHISSFH